MVTGRDRYCSVPPSLSPSPCSHSSGSVANYISDVYISDISFVLGKNPYVPSDYTLIPTDLNHGARGEYIYLVFKTTSDPKEAINGLNVFAGTRASGWPIQPGYIRIPQDLSLGAGGKFVYCCYTKTSSNPPITGLCVIKGKSPHVYPPDVSWVKIMQDCNQGSGGSFIYICYSYTAPSIIWATNITWAESPVECNKYNLCVAIVGIKHIS